jgi:hypothetical protein
MIKKIRLMYPKTKAETKMKFFTNLVTVKDHVAEVGEEVLGDNKRTR